MTRNALPLFLNPAAGRGGAGKKAVRIQRAMAAAGVTTTLVTSDGVGNLERKVFEHAARGCGPFIVAGGDGSVHEAVNGLLASGRDAPFGLIPVGTGNDFAKAAMIPLDWEAAATLLASRISEEVPVRRIDAGRMNDRYFANGAGIGFDAKINRIARKYRWPIGDLVYLIAVMEGLWDGVITPEVTMRYGDTEYRDRITLANVSNGPWVGGMFHIAPDSRIDDGELDLVYADPVSRVGVLRLLPKLLRGVHIGQTEIHTARVTNFELSAAAPLPSHLDGEVQPLQTEFRIEILPGALSLL